MRMDDFIDASNRAESAAQVFDIFQQALASFGFDRIVYGALRNHPDTVLPWTAGSYPDDWSAYYLSRNYTVTDPTRHRCLTSDRPFLWRDLAAQVPRDQAVIFAEAAEAGLKDGCSVSIHGPRGSCVAFGFASSQGGIETGPSVLARLNLLAVQFHAAYSAFVAGPPAPVPALTPREREILSWCAYGKSAWAIGVILGIAENSVEWHLKNIFRKLKAESRIAAVVQALNFGLISL